MDFQAIFSRARHGSSPPGAVQGAHSSIRAVASRSFLDSTNIVTVAALATAYFIFGKAGILLATISPSAPAVWVPSGIALAGCLLVGSWIWPAIFAAAFMVSFSTYGSLATSLSIGAGNTLEALIGAYLVCRFANGTEVFQSTRDSFKFVFLAALASTIVSATLGVASLYFAGYVSWSNSLWTWFNWWAADATGELIVAPFVILWPRTPDREIYRNQALEALLLVISLVLTTVLVFGGVSPFSRPEYPAAFLYIPLLLWSAFRFEPRDTATVVFLLSFAAVAGTLRTHGPFFGQSGSESLLILQTFVAVVGTSHLLVAIEVAERRRLEQARGRLCAMVESSDDAIIGMTSRGIITDWNAAASRIFEFSAADTIGKSIEIIVPQDLMGESEEVLAQISSGEAIASFETIRVRKSGARVEVSLTISPIKDEQGRIVGASAIARDIAGLTASRREREALLISERDAREAAERANRAKDEFLAMLGHELRNPLQAISIGAYLLDDAKNLETARSIISRQSEHISRIVDDLLDVARVSSGRIVLEQYPLDLAELVSDCVSTLRETGQLEQHRVDTRLQSVWVNGDFVRLNQLVTNLVDNAIKYTPPNGKLLIRTAAGKHAVFQIQDDGAGISADALHRVFDLFTRGDFGLQRSPSGLGIGLTLVKRIAELHGGAIEAASDGPGRGSTFTVSLPRVEAPQAGRAAAVGGTACPASRLRILIVEDNGDARKGLRTLLERSGHEIREAPDGACGLEQAVRFRPDVVLIDIGLPGINGYQVAAQIRSSPALSLAKLVALTGYAQTDYRARAAAAGFDAYLVKPVNARELERLIGPGAAELHPA